MIEDKNAHFGAENIRWSLSDLYSSRDTMEESLEAASGEAAAFAERYRGAVAKFDAESLANALDEYENVLDKLGRVYTYAYLQWVTDTNDAARGALLQHVKEQYTRISQQLIFFELEWAELEPDRAEDLLADDALASYKHYLEVEYQHREHNLTEPEEKIMSEKSVTGSGAWVRYFDETMGAARFELDGEEVTEQIVLSKLHEADRDLRKRAAISFTEGLNERRRTLTYIFNTLLAEKAANDRLRSYPHWLAGRNEANEVDDGTVDALVEAVTSRYDLAARFYRLKKGLLGLDEMMDFDRYAPLGEADTTYQWEEARAIVEDAYTDFHPQMGKIAGFFFDREWIDAPAAPGKRGGAFSHSAVPSAHPYVLLNYTGKIRDVQTLAHELGHGVHQYLSNRQGVLQSDTPLTTAEMASVFGEMLVFQRLLAAEEDPDNKLAMLVGKIDDTMATVFRQTAMNRFEDRIHSARRDGGELDVDDFSAHWIETQNEMFQGSVTLGDHYRSWWSYIPHFLHTPGYVYAYAFGELLVLALYAQYQQAGDEFPAQYLKLLEAGGSDWPHALLNRLNIDLTDPSFWNQGLEAIEAMIEAAEKLAGLEKIPQK